MTMGFSDQLQHLLGAPLGVPDARERVGDSLWLYCRLVAITNVRGIVCRTRESLSADLGEAEDVIDPWLTRLVDVQLVTIMNPAPFLVIKLCSWSSNDRSISSEPAENQQGEGSQSVQQSNVPVGSSLVPAGKAKLSNPGKPGVVGGLGEGEGLRAEAQTILAVLDTAPLRELLAKHSPARIRDALARVARTPPAQIRKSRFALFRYLLVQSPESATYDHDPPHQP